MSARILAEVLLESRDPALRESLVFCQDRNPEVEPVAGRLIRPDSIRDISEITELAVILAGLPGDAWGIAADQKARETLLSKPLSHDGINPAVLRLIPSGTKRTYALGISSSERHQAAHACPQFAGSDFSMKRFMDYFRAALAAVQWHDGIRVRATGHSYGAQALWRALAVPGQNDTPLPASATFLAPFVRNSLEPERQDIALRLRRKGGLEEGERETALPWGESVGRLETLLAYAGRLFALEDGVPLIVQHRHVLSPDFFDQMAPVPAVKDKRCPARIIMAGRDEYIGDAHADLLSTRLTGGATPLKMSVLPSEIHDMRNLDGGEFFS